MAKFCIHCGKKLEDGEVCACQANTQTQVASDNIGTDMLEAFKGMFARPVDTIKTYSDGKHFPLALILTGIFAFVTALFTCSLFKAAADVTVSSFGSISMYAMTSSYVDIPYLKIFFIALVITIIFVFLYTGLLFLVNSIMFKGDKDYKKVFAMYGVNTIIASVALLVSAIFMFIHLVLGLTVLALGMILNVVYLFKGIEYLGVKNQNRHGYIYLITTIFYAIVLFVIMLILS